jgi:hypothetical protein
MRKHPLAFFHDGQPDKTSGRNVTRTRELGGTPDGGRLEGVFSNKKEDGEFLIGQTWLARRSLVLRGGPVMPASAFDSKGDKIAHIAKPQAPRPAEQRGNRRCGLQGLREGGHKQQYRWRVWYFRGRGAVLPLCLVLVVLIPVFLLARVLAELGLGVPGDNGRR